MPTLILIAGPNGAGKTTFATEILTTDLKGCRFLNADEIARGLSPFDPSSVALKAGRILLEEVRDLVDSGTSFALESTFSGRAHTAMIRRAKAAGYSVLIHFLWLPSPMESIARVRIRVKKGGHFVPSSDIRRRFPRIMDNLVELYLPLADEWFFWDAQGFPPQALASSATHAISDVDRFIRP
jgi:predicted ABC-type ATPase